LTCFKSTWPGCPSFTIGSSAALIGRDDTGVNECLYTPGHPNYTQGATPGRLPKSQSGDAESRLRMRCNRASRST
jgi:hypothetical protein